MKGRTNNPNGRPKGKPNKITSDLRAKINEFLNNQWEVVEEDFKALEPHQRLNFYEKLISYCLPKNQISSTIVERPIFNGIDLDVEEEIETIRIFEIPNNHRSDSK